MRTSSRRARSALGALVLAAAAATTLTSADATPSGDRVRYDALGDSYASGYGVPPYDGCGRSSAAYPLQLEGRMRLHVDDFVACAGATTATLVSGGQLDALDTGTDLVTLTIGGNDIDWSTAVIACLTGTDADCAAGIAVTRRKVATVLPERLDAIYREVADRAPRARVLVVGYARLFSPEQGPFVLVSPAEQTAINEGADLLNEVVAETAAEHGFEFVDVTDRFVGHGVNAPVPWIVGAVTQGAFHPNAHGYRAYTAAVGAAVASGRDE